MLLGFLLIFNIEFLIFSVIWNLAEFDGVECRNRQ